MVGQTFIIFQDLSFRLLGAPSCIQKIYAELFEWLDQQAWLLASICAINDPLIRWESEVIALRSEVQVATV